MPQSPQDLYARLLSSTRGYPLWTPEPRNEFLIERREGLRIGDVGVVTPDLGGFDALFNLCLPPNHSFHTRFGVPDNFTCIRPEELEIWTDFSAEPHGRVILTPSVTRVGAAHSSTEAPQRDESGVSTYRFNLSPDEGALLILPEGAERHELLNDGLFVKQASQNAAKWYNYAVDRRGRIISQDALYVITGLYKTRTWSVAAFENVAGNESYAAHYKHIPDRSSTAPTHGWETTRASLHWRAGTSIDYGTPSQTVFIRGLKIALRNGFLGSRWVRVEADVPSKARSNPVKPLTVVPSNSRVRDSLASLMGREGGSTSGTTMHTELSTDTAKEQAESNISDQGEYDGMHVEIQRVPDIPPAFHPSSAINRYLLRKDPSANIAITCDSIWMSILEEKSLTIEEFDQDFRPEEVLFQNFDMVSHEGVVRLERKNPQISASRNKKDAEYDHINAEFQSLTTSRIGPLDKQPLSHSLRGSPEPNSQSMGSVAIVPIDLGYAAAFDPSIFPAEYYAEDDNIDKGIILIRATLKEMEKINELGIDRHKNEDFIFNTRLELENLRSKQAKLEDNHKSLNPFKVFPNYRAARLLHEGSKSLYLETKRTSGKIYREADSLQVVPRTQMRRIVSKSSLIVSIPGSTFTHDFFSGPIHQGVKVGGIAIMLPDGFNENVERTIGDARDTMATIEVDAFQDNCLVPQLGDDEQEATLANTESILSQDDEEDEGDRPTVSTINSMDIYNPMVAVNSSVNAPTIDRSSRSSCGEIITQGPTP